MAHALSIVFFFGLLVALPAILEMTFRAHWAAICAAVRGAPAAKSRPALVRRSRRLGAAA